MPPRKKTLASPQVADANLLDPTLPDPEDAHLFDDGADGEGDDGGDGDDVSAAAPALAPAASPAPAPRAAKLWGRLLPYDPENGQPTKAINARRRLFTAGVWVEVTAEDRAVLKGKIGQKPKGGAALRMFEFAEGERRPSR